MHDSYIVHTTELAGPPVTAHGENSQGIIVSTTYHAL